MCILPSNGYPFRFNSNLKNYGPTSLFLIFFLNLKKIYIGYLPVVNSITTFPIFFPVLLISFIRLEPHLGHFLMGDFYFHFHFGLVLVKRARAAETASLVCSNCELTKVSSSNPKAVSLP